MKLTVGNVIRNARLKKELSRERLAKKLKISKGYLGHLEIDTPVRLSDRIIGELQKAFGPKMRVLNKLAVRHNQAVRRYQKKYS